MKSAHKYQIKKSSGTVVTVVGDQNLKIMACDGRLKKTDHIRIAGKSKWHLAGTVKNLNFDAAAKDAVRAAPPSMGSRQKPIHPAAKSNSATQDESGATPDQKIADLANQESAEPFERITTRTTENSIEATDGPLNVPDDDEASDARKAEPCSKTKGTSLDPKEHGQSPECNSVDAGFSVEHNNQRNPERSPTTDDEAPAAPVKDDPTDDHLSKSPETPGAAAKIASNSSTALSPQMPSRECRYQSLGTTVPDYTKTPTVREAVSRERTRYRHLLTVKE